jgi:hypothetical protein
VSDSNFPGNTSSRGAVHLPALLSPRPPERALAAQVGADSSASLGTIAKFASPASQCGISTGVGRQVRRFYLQAAARELVPRERVAKCLRAPIPAAGSVDVLYAPVGRSAHYGGLQVCASVWHCPVCSAKITERRRVELSSALEVWRGIPGARLVLATFTVQHRAGESLSTLLGPVVDGWRFLKAGKWWQRFERSHAVAGSIRALELTHGAHGWHPHLHVLFFLWRDLQILPFEGDLKSRWSHTLERQGRWASWSHGVDVRYSDEHIAEYVAKYGKEPEWTIEHEMTKNPSKMGRNGGRTPLQLLADYSEGDTAAGVLWREYAAAMKGRKQLVWSRGLRDILNLAAEETDEQVAGRQDEIAVVLASLTHRQWRHVLGNDARGELLEVASAGDAGAVWRFLRGLGVEV